MTKSVPDAVSRARPVVPGLTPRILVIGESVAGYAAAARLAGEVRVTHARHGVDDYLHATRAWLCGRAYRVLAEDLEGHAFDLFRRFGVERGDAFDWLEDVGACVRGGRGADRMGECFDAAIFAPQGSGPVVPAVWNAWWGTHASTDAIGDTAYGFTPSTIAMCGSGPHLVQTVRTMRMRGFRELTCLVEGADPATLAQLEDIRATASFAISVVTDVVSVSPLRTDDAFHGVRVARRGHEDSDHFVSFVGFAGELAARWDGIRGPIGRRFHPCGVALGVSPYDFVALWSSGESVAQDVLKGLARQQAIASGVEHP